MSTRKCFELEAFLEEAAEARQTAALRTDLESHLRECGDCRLRWAEARFLDDALVVWAAALPSVDLVSSVLAPTASDGNASEAAADDRFASISRCSAEENRSIRCDPPRHDGFAENGAQKPAVPRSENHRRDGRPAGRVEPRWSAVAIVAGAMLAVGGLGWSLLRAPIVSSDPAVARPEDPAVLPRQFAEDAAAMAHRKTPASSEGADVELTGLIREAGTAYLSLAEDAADRVRDVASLVAAAPQRLSSGGDASARPSSANPENEDGSANGWGKRLGRAFEFLMEAMPEDESPAS